MTTKPPGARSGSAAQARWQPRAALTSSKQVRREPGNFVGMGHNPEVLPLQLLQRAQERGPEPVPVARGVPKGLEPGLGLAKNLGQPGFFGLGDSPLALQFGPVNEVPGGEFGLGLNLGLGPGQGFLVAGLGLDPAAVRFFPGPGQDLVHFSLGLGRDGLTEEFHLVIKWHKSITYSRGGPSIVFHN